MRSTLLNKRITIITGGFGSGKTEISLNLARRKHKDGKEVHIADLDIVNPYFRSRELKKKFSTIGIRVISPSDDYHHSDLPIILPEIRGILEDKTKNVIVDLGGDDTGSRVLRSLKDALSTDEADFLFVVNKSRPFTSTIEKCLNTMERVENTTGMKITGLIANNHLIDETNEELIYSGFNFAQEVSKAKKIPIIMVAIMDKFQYRINKDIFCEPILWLDRTLFKPWEE